ncbi:MAG: metallophosphoesterase family protein, partial [Anaerolineae bacterium]
MRIAQISDLHFAVPTINPLQFFSKRWIGNINLAFSRKKKFTADPLLSLVKVFKEALIDHVIISGDLTTTSQKTEFTKALQLVKHFKEAGIGVFAIPGNHDHYTKKAYRERLFYRYFDAIYHEENSFLGNFNLRDHGITIKKLNPSWWLVALDTALATSLFSSQGYFSPVVEKHLEDVLACIPVDEHILLINHFPFFQHESSRKTLLRGEALRERLRNASHVKLYLHGHTHRHCVADLRASGFPIILDSGSTSHHKRAAWNLIELNKGGCFIQVYMRETASSTNEWQISHQCS